MEAQALELTETQLLADIHNMLSDIHEAMFSEDELDEETESESDEAELDEESEADDENEND